MSRLARRPRANHQQSATDLTANPGEWLVIGDYRSSIGADGIAHCIRTGYPIGAVTAHNPYQPVGAFETRTELVEDGIRLYARYVGGGAA